MSKTRIAIGVAVLLSGVAAVGAYLLLGFVRLQHLDADVTVLMRHNGLRQIGANIVVYAGPTGTVVVDTQLPQLASLTSAAVHDVSPLPVTNVIVTHWHPDHSGGIAAFSDDADVIAHANVTKRLSVAQEGFGLTKPGSHHEFAARAADGLPTISVTDRFDLDLDLKSAHVEVFHYPRAHTDGDLAVFFHSAKIVAVGDLIWPESFPYVDVHNGGSVIGLEAAVRDLLDNADADYRFVPGHGRILSFNDVHDYLNTLSESRRWIESQIDEGRTAEQIASSRFAAQWQSWASPLVPWPVWLQTVHTSYKPAQIMGDGS